MTATGMSSQGDILVLHFWVKGNWNIKMETPIRKVKIHDWNLGEKLELETWYLGVILTDVTAEERRKGEFLVDFGEGEKG